MRKVIEGSVDLDGLNLTELFDLSDVEVTDWFACSNNNLTSLKGCPHTVGGGFHCHNNNLSSLVGAPSAVGGGFDCGENPLNSLEGIPEIIGYGFYISAALKDKFSEKYIRTLSDIQGTIHFI